MEWTREKTLMLIEEYQKRRGLWDMTHEDYRKKSVKRQLLTEVAEKINMTLPINEIEKKFHTLRTQYHREINRMKHYTGEDYKSKWFAFRHLEFLSSPKACRGSKTDLKSSEKTVNIKKENNSPATYIIKQLQQEHENNRQVGNEKEVNQRLLQEQLSTTATEFLSIPKKNTLLVKRDNHESQKDFEKLIQETTKDVEEIEEIIDNSDFKVRMKSIPVQHNYATQDMQTIEHYIDDHEQDNLQVHQETNANTILQQDGNEYHSGGAQTAIIRIQKRDLAAIEKISYEDPFETKKIKLNNCGSRDECAIYGEYVANEMRMITAREILINLKHKINLALFEANMSQLNKERL